MPDLGTRGNVMGPQPIERRSEIPPDMIAAAKELLGLIVARQREAIAALAMPAASREVAEFAAAVPHGGCDGYEIIATARSTSIIT